MDISTLDIKELKALAYDESLKLESAKQNIQIIQAEIRNREQDAVTTMLNTNPKEAGASETPTSENLNAPVAPVEENETSENKE